MDGGDNVGQVLHRQGVTQLFTLCGGHISPILTGAKRLGIGIVDVRDEATAVSAIKPLSGTRQRTGTPGDHRALDILELLVERRSSEAS